MSLQALPEELLVHIAELTHYSAQLNLALTCRQLHRCCIEELKVHQRLAAAHHTVVAQQAFASPFLRAAIEDSAVPWHVRTAEIWCGDDFNIPRELDFKISGDRLDQDESLRLRRLFAARLGAQYEKSNFWVPPNAEGNSASLLSLVCCPRLKKLVYTNDTRTASTVDTTNESVLELNEIVKSLYFGKRPWPPSLQSLRSISIDIVGPGARYGQERYLPIHPSRILSLLLLPGLHSLSVCGLSSDEGWTGPEGDLEMPMQCSQVRELYIKGAVCTVNDLLVLLDTTRQVEVLKLEYCEWAAEQYQSDEDEDNAREPGGSYGQIVTYLSQNHRDTLRTFLINGISDDNLSSSAATTHNPVTLWRSFSNLRHISVQLADLKPYNKTSYHVANQAVISLEDVFAPTLEYLHIIDSFEVINFHIEALDNAIAMALRGNEYPELKTADVRSGADDPAVLAQLFPGTRKHAAQRGMLFQVARHEADAEFPGLPIGR